MSSFPSTWGVSNRNPVAEQQYKKNEQEFAFQTNYSRMTKPFANPTYMNKLQYYNSHVLNGHMYPNMFHIKPVDFNERQSNVGSFLIKSIDKNKKFYYGGQLHDVKRIDMWD